VAGVHRAIQTHDHDLRRAQGRRGEIGRPEFEMDLLWLFLQESGVAPTNNHAERMLRFALLWRKRSFGTVS
jgi:hypothetical protein